MTAGSSTGMEMALGALLPPDAAVAAVTGSGTCMSTTATSIPYAIPVERLNKVYLKCVDNTGRGAPGVLCVPANCRT